MELKKVINYVLNGDATLFLGAGFSREATNIIDKPMSDAIELSHKLCEELNVPKSSNLAKVSNHYLTSASSSGELEYRKMKLIEYIQNLYITKSFKDYHKIIVNCPWRRVYTTNYDDVVEKAHKSAIKSFSMHTDIYKILREKSVVHLNGYCRTVTKEKLDNEFKLTQRSYLSDDFLNSSSHSSFKHDIRNSKVIVLIGVSFESDLDIQRLILANKGNKEKVVFIDKPEDSPDYIEDSAKNNIGIQYKIGVKKFGELINEQLKDFMPTSKNNQWESFNKVDNSYNRDFYELIEKNIWDLLLSGSINESLINANINNNEYLIQRKKIDNVIDSISKNESKIEIIHSNLGNGKTVFLKLLMFKLAESYNVFELKSTKENWEYEIERIMKIEGRKIIIIDNYYNEMKLIYKLLDLIDESVQLVFAGRTFVHNSTYGNLIEKIGDPKLIKLYDISILSADEIDNLCLYLEKRKFTEIFGRELKDVRNTITTVCNRRLSNVLLHIIESPSISDRLKKTIEPILKDKNKRDCLIAIIISNTCPLDLEFDDIVELLSNYNEISLIDKDKEFAEFIDVYNNKIIMKSSILSSFILKNHNLNIEVVKIMKKMVENSTRLSESNSKKIREKLISVSTIQKLLVRNLKDGTTQVNTQILSYFHGLTEYPEFKSNIFFWLQYAMAAIDAKEYDRSRVYFENAYKIANSVYDFNTYQIDTQFGRYLLEQGLNEDIVHSSDTFKEALSNWTAAFQKKPDRSSYVSNQLYLIKPYLNKYLNEWSTAEVKDIYSEIIVFKKKFNTLVSREIFEKLFEDIEKIILQSVAK